MSVFVVNHAQVSDCSIPLGTWPKSTWGIPSAFDLPWTWHHWLRGDNVRRYVRCRLCGTWGSIGNYTWLCALLRWARDSALQTLELRIQTSSDWQLPTLVAEPIRLPISRAQFCFWEVEEVFGNPKDFDSSYTFPSTLGTIQNGFNWPLTFCQQWRRTWRRLRTSLSHGMETPLHG